MIQPQTHPVKKREKEKQRKSNKTGSSQVTIWPSLPKTTVGPALHFLQPTTNSPLNFPPNPTNLPSPLLNYYRNELASTKEATKTMSQDTRSEPGKKEVEEVRTYLPHVVGPLSGGQPADHRLIYLGVCE